MIVRLWQPGDTEKLMLQPSQMYMGAILKDLNLEPLAVRRMAWVGETEEGIVGIAGLSPQWEGRATAWALISTLAGKHFFQIHKQVLKFLVECPFRRVEATVDVGFEPGHRWVKMLGFEPEGYLRAYRPDGGDQILYARVRR